MHKVEWPIDGSAQFPERCLLCDGEVAEEPTRVTELTRKFGKLLVRLRAPICPPCEATRRKRRLAWVAVFFGYVGTIVSAVWLVQRTGWSETHGSLMFFVTCVFVGTCFYWFVKEESAFLRRYTRIWIEALGTSGKALVLASDDAKLVKELRAIVDVRKKP